MGLFVEDERIPTSILRLLITYILDLPVHRPDESLLKGWPQVSLVDEVTDYLTDYPS